jgi:hypothetical protein
MGRWDRMHNQTKIKCLLVLDIIWALCLGKFEQRTSGQYARSSLRTVPCPTSHVSVARTENRGGPNPRVVREGD